MENRLLLATFTVTTTADVGPGSLRQAILDANAASGADVIRFAIPGAGVQTIALLSPLPPDTGGVTIDGATQPGYTRAPLIQLDGSAAGPSADGLMLLGENSTVRALAINRFAGNGVLLFGRISTVADCYVGVDPTGERAAGNGGDGVFSVGPATTGVFTGPRITGSVISANGRSGVRIVNGASSISGNMIGVNAAGTARLGNGSDGVQVLGGATTIGVGNTTTAGAGRNVISGNAASGIHATGADVLIVDNYIGIDAAGSTAIENGAHGILLEGTTGNIGGGVRRVPTLANVISGNRGNGIMALSVTGPGGTNLGIRGNRIGTDAAGDPVNATLGNGGDGIALVNVRYGLVGGEDAAAPNTIAFNGGSGVSVNGQDPSTSSPTNVQVRRNSIFSNGRLGIDLVGPADPATGVTPNDPGDADRGPNALLNYPQLLAATSRPGGSTTIGLRLDVPAGGTYRVEFFANAVADPSGFGEGRTFVADAVVSPGTQPTVLTIPAVPVGTALTATVTETTRRFTSEFSAPVTVTAFVAPQVVGRYALSGAIVPEKQALLPGQTGSFANVVTQSRGITGVAMDVSGLALPEALTVDDFAFRRMASDGSEWFNYTLPRTLSVARGAGAGGSDRVTVTFTNPWFDRWMEVTLKGTDATGVPRPDVFYFGQRTGEAGDAVTPLRVTAIDLAATRRALGTTVPPGGSPYDFNRDGAINALDLEIVRRNLGRRLIAFVAPTAA